MQETLEETKTQTPFVVISTWADTLAAIADLHNYLDICKEQGKKERLALDLETYLCKVSRDRYDREFSLEQFKPTERKRIEAGELEFPSAEYPLIKADEYPVPRPVLNKHGEYDARVRLLQIGIHPEQVNIQYLFDLDLVFEDLHPGLNVDKAPEAIVMAFYRKIGNEFRSLLRRTVIIGQNLKYEYGFLWKFFRVRLNERRDVGLMNQILNMGDKIDGKLSNLYARYLDETKFEIITGMTFSEYHNFKATEQVSPWYEHPLDYKQYLYAAHDVQLIWGVFDRLCIELTVWAATYDSGRPGRGTLEVVLAENELTAAIAKAEIIGVPGDNDYYFNELKPGLLKEIEEVQEEANRLWFKTIVKKKKRVTNPEAKKKDRIIEHYEEITHEPYNLNSPDQVAEILGPELCKELPMTPSGKVSTSAKELFFLRDKHPVVPLVLKIKRALKKISFFESANRGYFVYQDSEGFIHHGVYQIGTDEHTVASGRMAGSKPNLMNVLRLDSIRRFFCAPKGYKLIVLDYSQIQLWIAAWLCKDRFLTDCFMSGRDLHSETAKIVFELDFLPDKNIESQKLWRDKGKTMRFAKTFQMGLQKFLRTVYVDTDGAVDYVLRGEEGIEEAKVVIARLDATTPEVTHYREQVEAKVRDSAKQFKSFADKRLRRGEPYYVSVNPALERTRRFSLSPEDRALASKHPEDYEFGNRVLYERTGNISTWANRCNSIIRDTAREAFNNEIQSPEADIVKLAIVGINKRLEDLADQGIIDEYKEGFILPVHDELVLIAKDCNAQLIHDIAKDEMAKAAARFNTTIPLKISGCIGQDWSIK